MNLGPGTMSPFTTLAVGLVSKITLSSWGRLGGARTLYRPSPETSRDSVTGPIFNRQKSDHSRPNVEIRGKKRKVDEMDVRSHGVTE